MVPVGWLTTQLAFATAGWEAVAGVVDIARDDPILHERFGAVYPELLADGAHTHVHGANFGVRADAYAAVGGWPIVASTGEDHRLWEALRIAGHRRLATTEPRVTTSHRLSARAPGGFAARLRELTT